LRGGRLAARIANGGKDKTGRDVVSKDE
jgi:hypothetical protein